MVTKSYALVARYMLVVNGPFKLYAREEWNDWYSSRHVEFIYTKETQEEMLSEEHQLNSHSIVPSQP